MSKMNRVTRLILASALALCILFEGTRAAATVRSRGKKKAGKQNEINVCEMEKAQSPIYCYCNDITIRNATDVNCIVLDKFDVNDPVWTYFTSQMYLKKLSFVVRGTGSLDYIPGQVLKQFKQIDVLAIHNSRIQELPEHAFYILPTLSKIDLSKNTIVNLKKYAFDSVKNLTIVNLDENHIAEIHRNVFFSLPAMRELFLNENNISIVHDKAFEHLTNLRELELGSNHITVLTSDMFHGLRSLTRLDLRHNQISMIGDHTFIEVPDLVELVLDQNSIEYISAKALHGLRNLQKLRLSENKLVSLEADFLGGAPLVNLLDIRDNKLRTMTFDNIKPIITNLYNTESHFYLEGNKLICDCKLAWIWGLRNETKNARLRDALEELTCYLESNNATTLKINNEELERKQALEIARNHNGYFSDNLRNANNNGNNNDEYGNYMEDTGDEYDDDTYDDESSHSNSAPKVEIVGGKTWYEKHLFELKPEDLPCPETTTGDLMASEQPSSRFDNGATIGSWGSSWFRSSSMSVGQFAIAYPLFVIISILFT